MYIKKLFLILLAAAFFASCEKVQPIDPKENIIPAVPVTVQNAVDYRPDPTVTTTLSGTGAIQIILSIPAGSGRTIKEITKVAANTTYSQIQSTGTTGFYNSAPIAGNGTTVTFNTTLTEYVTKGPGVLPAANNELAKRFYFLITLDDGSVIVTYPVRVLVLA